MNKTQVNPWTWQEAFGFSQAWRVDAAESMVFVAGQGPITPDGQLTGEGDFEAQVRQTFENLGVVLEQAGMSLANLVKTNVYLTDIATLREYGRIKSELLPGPQPASTAVQVTGLAAAGMMLELDAIAVS